MLEIPLLELSGHDCCIQGVTAITARFLENHIIPQYGRPILAGNSFGGHVALRLAIEHPHLVRALVLAGSSGLIERSIVADIQIRPSREWLRKKIAELFFDQSKMREADLDRAFAALSARGGARAMVKLSRSARRNHLGDLLSTIQCPVFLIWGKQDIVTPPEAAEGFLRYLPHAKIDWYDRCGHAPMIECPDQFAASLIRFAEALPPQSR
jgi:pimeloyl-ACP methyl ester carboxylesterase